MTNTLTFSYSANVIEVEPWRQQPRPRAAARRPRSRPTTRAPTRSRQARRSPDRCRRARHLQRRRPSGTRRPGRTTRTSSSLKDDFSAVFGQHFLKAGCLLQLQQEERGACERVAGVRAVQRRDRLSRTQRLHGRRGRPATRSADLLLSDMVWNTAEIQSNQSVQVALADLEFYAADSVKLSPRADGGHRRSSQPPDAARGGERPLRQLRSGDGRHGVRQLALQRHGLRAGNEPVPRARPRGWHRRGQPVSRCRPSSSTSDRASVSPGTSSATARRSIRGGFGLFYQRERVSPALGIGQNPPFSGVGAVTRTIDSNQSVTGNVVASATARPATPSSRRRPTRTTTSGTPRSSTSCSRTPCSRSPTWATRASIWLGRPT